MADRLSKEDITALKAIYLRPMSWEELSKRCIPQYSKHQDNEALELIKRRTDIPCAIRLSGCRRAITPMSRGMSVGGGRLGGIVRPLRRVTPQTRRVVLGRILLLGIIRYQSRGEILGSSNVILINMEQISTPRRQRIMRVKHKIFIHRDSKKNFHR